MIDRQQLLADLKPLLRELEADLRARCDEVAQINADLTKEYEQARAANRAGITFEEWRADLITQVAVAWVLSSVFVRFLEDNGLISSPRISGPLHSAGDGQGLMRARDERDVFFRSHPKQTDRDYLLAVFDDLAKLPGTKDVFGPHNLVSVYRDWLSGDAAQKLIEFFQKIDADGTGEISHDFSDPDWDTRFLGDLYQDLSEAARKKYALLQTPIFVEEFILDRTLEPAIKEFGLKDFKMIDPACGSGHFVLGGFARILNHWRKAEPGTSNHELVNRALASVHGVDLNPYAVAIARFRLLLTAMRECRVSRLKDAPNFQFNLVCGDSLLHGSTGQQVMGFHELAHHYQSEDIDELRRILKPGQYQAVVANPPYITVKDKVLNQAYRDRYPEVCHRQYSLSVPFLQRLLILACEKGFTGQITANSFMKREFGKKLIENYLPKIDLTHVIDTSGAYVPGHGTPTVILFCRHRKPIVSTIRAVMGIKGEPSTPENPAQGMVWSAILDQIDQVDSQSSFVSVNDAPREQLARHPWSIGGGGAAELKETIEERGEKILSEIATDIGFGAVTREDEAYLLSSKVAARQRIPRAQVRPLVEGEVVRDWEIREPTGAIWPYDPETLDSRGPSALLRLLWPVRAILSDRVAYGMTQLERGLQWYEYSMFFKNRFRAPLSIVFAFVATHNHFVFDRGGKVFKQSAPIIKLPLTATEDDHLALLGLLNSSAACFWMKQVFHNKGATSDKGVLQADPEKFRYEFDSTKLGQFPIPDLAEEPHARLVALTRALSDAGYRLSLFTFQDAISNCLAAEAPLAESIQKCIEEREISRRMMARWQEELDWLSYEVYGLVEPDSSARSLAFSYQPKEMPPLAAELRSYRLIGSGNSTEAAPIDVARIDLTRQHPQLRLIEAPEYKRRWFRSAGAYDATNLNDQMLVERGARGWLLDRLESYFDLDGRMNDQCTVTVRSNLHEPRLTNVAKVGDLAKQDREFMQVAELYAGRMDFDVANFVDDLIAAESVPCLPVLRYKPTGLDKRAAWERTWELQRLEDGVDALFNIELLKNIRPSQTEATLRPLVTALCIDEKIKLEVLRETVSAAGYVAEATRQKLDPHRLVTDAAKRAKKRAVGEGDIPVPPKYTNADFLSGSIWRLRGKLDVPKERWVSFPNCEGEDGTLVIAWAGYDHLQLARAIAEHYEHAKEHEGRKLVPLLACIGQLIPWLKQWHNELDPAFGTRMGDYFENYLAEESKTIGMSVNDVMAWTPPPKAKKAGRKNKVEVE
jgi:hypothetical protein